MQPSVWVAKGEEIGAPGKEALWTLLIPLCPLASGLCTLCFKFSYLNLLQFRGILINSHEQQLQF